MTSSAEEVNEIEQSRPPNLEGKAGNEAEIELEMLNRRTVLRRHINREQNIMMCSIPNWRNFVFVEVK